MTYAGVALASIISQVYGGISMRVEQWYLAAPALGANQIIVSLSGNARVVGGAVSLTGADQTPAAIDASNSTQGSGFFIALANVSLTTVSNNVWIVDTLVSRRSSVLPLSGQTLRWDVQTTGGGNFRIRGSGSTLGPIVNPGTQNLRWLVVSANAQWAIAATAITPATAAPPGLLSWREITQ